MLVLSKITSLCSQNGMHGKSIYVTEKITEIFIFRISQIKLYHVWGFYHHLTPPYFEDMIDDVT